MAELDDLIPKTMVRQWSRIRVRLNDTQANRELIRNALESWKDRVELAGSCAVSESFIDVIVYAREGGTLINAALAVQGRLKGAFSGVSVEFHD